MLASIGSTAQLPWAAMLDGNAGAVAWRERHFPSEERRVLGIVSTVNCLQQQQMDVGQRGRQ